MYKTERELFCRALTETFVRKYEQELSACRETADCSEAHTLCMQEIVAQSAKAERRKDRRKWIVALLVAAALLLTACTVYAYQEEIRDYIERIFHGHITITYVEETDGEDANILVDKYILGYVPDGYTLIEEQHLLSLNKYIWENAEGQWLTFEQCALDSTNYVLDAVLGDTTIISCDEFDVYYRETKIHSYIWNNGIYSFKITSDCFLEKSELECIIDGLHINQ